VSSGELSLENLGGYGVFLDEFSGPWTLKRCSFAHMEVIGPGGRGDDVVGAGPGTMIDCEGLSHVVVRGRTNGEIQIIGSTRPACLEVPWAL